MSRRSYRQRLIEEAGFWREQAPLRERNPELFWELENHRRFGQQRAQARQENSPRAVFLRRQRELWAVALNLDICKCTWDKWKTWGHIPLHVLLEFAAWLRSAADLDYKYPSQKKPYALDLRADARWLEAAARERFSEISTEAQEETLLSLPAKWAPFFRAEGPA